MKLSKVKKALSILEDVNFLLPNGHLIPITFEVTEIEVSNTNKINSEGTIRNEKVVHFLLSATNTTDHKTKAKNLLNMINLTEKKLAIEDFEIEVKYLNETITTFKLGFNGIHFLLINNHINVLTQNEQYTNYKHSNNSAKQPFIPIEACS